MSREQLLRLSHCLILTIILVSLLTLLIPLSVVKADSVVNFPDANLQAAIRAAIGKPSGDIYQSDLSSLTALDADGKGIVDLTGLESCTSLKNLWLDRNQISNISPLSGLTSLTWLVLNSNQISDISPLSGLTSLKWLNLDSNQVSDLSPLSGLTSLTELALGNNQISDISPLSGLTNLEYLGLGGNQISDIEPLVNNPGMDSGDKLDLHGNPLNRNSVNTCIPALQGRGVIVSWDAPANRPPTQPSNVSPVNGATGVGLAPILKSSAFSDQDTFDTFRLSQWQVTSTSGDYSNCVLGCSGDYSSTDTSLIIDPVILSLDTKYYWHVRYQDQNGAWSEWSAETSFTTGSPPGQSPNSRRGTTWGVWAAVAVAVLLLVSAVVYYWRKRSTSAKLPPGKLPDAGMDEVMSRIRETRTILEDALRNAVKANDPLWISALRFLGDELDDLYRRVELGTIGHQDAEERIGDLRKRVDRLREPPRAAGATTKPGQQKSEHVSLDDLARMNLGVTRNSDSYEVLGVTHTASKEEVDTAYKQKMREWHPDRFSTKRGLEISNAVSKLINNARDEIYRQKRW